MLLLFAVVDVQRFAAEGALRHTSMVDSVLSTIAE